jgi:hypothetical protein
MSGRKQHFIQQLLQKGFSFDWQQDPCHIWVYRRDGKVFSPSLDGYGAERDFYGDPEQSDLDNQITEIENNRFNQFLNDLRKGANRNLDSHAAAAFAIHLFFRSKNFRSMLTAGLEPLMARSRAMLRNPDILERLIASGVREKSKPILDALTLAGIPPSQQTPTLAFIEQNSILLARQFIAKNSSQIENYLEKVLASAAPVVAAAHRKSLSEKLNDLTGSRVEMFKAMHWQILQVDGCLISGDSVVFAELANGSFKPVSEPNDVLAYMWVPISHNRILVGSPNNAPPNVDATRINRGAASCSFDAFCAFKGPNEYASLIPLIRTSTFSLDETAIEQIAQDSISKALQ